MSKIQVTNINDLSDNASLITQNGGIKSDKLTGVTTAGSILVTGEGNSTTTNLQQGLAKLWATLDADASTVVAFDSFNVSSVQDDATGKYGVTATSAMSNANYYMCGVCSHPSQAESYDRYLSNSFSGGNIDARKTTTQLKTGSYGTDWIETYVVGLSIHGDLA